MFERAVVNPAPLGVNSPVRTAAPAAAGIQAHFATNGAADAVATASQPLMTAPPNMNLTTPAELAVPLIVIGPRS